jgi:hypothetical protein
LYFISKYSLTAAPEQAILSYTLTDAISGQGIKELEEGDTINLAALRGRKINIQVNTDPPTVGSVKMSLNDKVRIDNTAPYTVKGSVNEAHVAWHPAPGKYTLTSTAYSSKNAGGMKGESLTITFHVVARSVSMPSVTTLDEKFTVHPNPVVSVVTVSGKEPVENNVLILVRDFTGRIRHQYELKAGETAKDIDLSRLPKGVYFLKITSAGEACVKRIIKQ